MTTVTLPKALLDQVAAPYRLLGNVAWRFARGKLGGDPAFAGLLQRGLIPSHARILDIGCGRGLLAALLCGLDTHPGLAQDWPDGWAPAPQGVNVRGIELMSRDVERARQALAHLGPRVEFVQGDMCLTDFGRVDTVVMLDVLHYVNHPAQDDVLRRVRAALIPGGTLLLRIGNASAGLPFRISNWVDIIVNFMRGNRLSRLYCRSLSGWQQALTGLGFEISTVPMHEGTPFSNILLVARLPATLSATAP
jgi:2-polyprenyl-3-methyl-5-hydroxy-6-metoxy-1,4-benzoquinol methylase